MVSAEVRQQAIQELQREIQSGRSTIGQRSDAVQKEFFRLRNVAGFGGLTPQRIQELSQQVSTTRLRAQELGFRSAREFQQTSAVLGGRIAGSPIAREEQARRLAQQETKEQLEKIKVEIPEKSIKKIGEEQFFPGVTLERRPKFFVSERTGAVFVVGQTPELKRPRRKVGTPEDIQPTISIPKTFSFADTSFSGGFEQTQTSPMISVDPKTLDVRITTGTTPLPQPKPKEVPVFITKRPSISDIARDTAFLESTISRETFKGQIGGLIAGVGVSIVGTGTALAQVIKDPLGTTRQVIESIPTIPTKIRTARDIIISEPAFALGFAAGEFAQFRLAGAGIRGARTLVRKGVRVVRKPPTPQLKFLSDIQQSGRISRVDVVSITDIGKRKVGAFSRQIVLEIDEVVNLGLGKGVAITKVKGGRIFTRFDITGATKRLGKARRLTPISSLKEDISRLALVDDLGIGVRSKVITQDISRVLRREGIGIFPEFKRLKVPKKTPAKVTDITGAIRDISGQLDDATRFVFRGTTKKPITRISKEGITLRFQEPNIRGIIKVTQKPLTKSEVKFLTPSTKIKRTPLSKTFALQTKQIQELVSPKQLSRAVQKSITEQVGGQIQQAKRISMLVEPIQQAKVSKVLPAITRTRFADQTTQRFTALNLQKFSDLGVLESRFKKGISKARTRLDSRTILKQAQPTKARTKQELQLRTLLDEKTLLGERGALKTKLSLKSLLGVATQPALRSRLALRTRTLLRTKTGLRTSVAITPPFIPITSEPIPLPFAFLKSKPTKKKKKRRGKVREDIFFTPGFVSKVLGIKQELSLKELGGLSALGLRPIPIIK